MDDLIDAVGCLSLIVAVFSLSGIAVLMLTSLPESILFYLVGLVAWSVLSWSVLKKRPLVFGLVILVTLAVDFLIVALGQIGQSTQLPGGLVDAAFGLLLLLLLEQAWLPPVTLFALVLSCLTVEAVLVWFNVIDEPWLLEKISRARR